MKNRSLLISLALLVAAGSAGLAYFQATSVGGNMTDQAEKYLATFTSEQRAASLLEYDTPQRVKRHSIRKTSRKGLQNKEMNDNQRKAAHALLKSCLSDAGDDKAQKSMALETILHELETKKGTRTNI